MLSQAGRNTLIKSVASALPVYNMSVLQLLAQTTKAINKNDETILVGLHTIKWTHMCRRIEDGGLGIQDSRHNNLTLLTKTS